MILSKIVGSPESLQHHACSAVMLGKQLLELTLGLQLWLCFPLMTL